MKKSPNKHLPIAELYVAYAYICDCCGIENFVNSVILEFDEETAQELKEDYGIEKYEEGEWVHIPAEVTCKECGTHYRTKDSRLDPEDDEDDYDFIEDPESE